MRRHQVICAAVVMSAVCAQALVATDAYSSTAHSSTASRPSKVSTVLRREGRRIYVNVVHAGELAPGMSVWVSESGLRGRGGLPIAEAKVLFVHGRQAVVELAEGAPKLPRNAVVEPRYIAEARLYGRSNQLKQSPGTAPHNAVSTQAERPKHRTWHVKPKAVAWGGQLWLEIVATEEVKNVELRWRVGRTGAYQSVRMKRANDGMWTANVKLGETPPALRQVQYYIVGQIEHAGAKPEHTSLRGHPGNPLRVNITSVPSRRRTRMVEHEPPGRVSHNEELVLTAQLNARFSNPVVFFRPRGGGNFDAVPMKQVTPQVYRAVLPARKIVVPGLSYYIAATDDKGIARDGFAGRRHPHHVKVTRGKILSPDSVRNGLVTQVSTVDYGGAGDRYNSATLRFERRFFGFLVARLGAEMVDGMVPRLVTTAGSVAGTLEAAPLNLYLGNAGLQGHIGNYLSLHFDTVLGIHNDGAAIGYEAGVRIGDEAGAHLSVSRRVIDELDGGRELISRFRAALGAPIGDRLRVAGAVIHEDIGQDASRGLRLQVEASYTIGDRFTAGVQGGLAGRDADRVSATTGLSLGLLF
jgi:hypothetical protein